MDESTAASDGQITELAGRHFSISQLLAGGVEVALPVRDRGIDLIAYLDRSGTAPQFLACPIQLKANSVSRFSLDQKYERILNLLMVHVHNVHDPELAVVYALTYDESLALLHQCGYTTTKSWEKGNYSLRVGAKWRKLLEPYEMNADGWKRRIEKVLDSARDRNT